MSKHGLEFGMNLLHEKVDMTVEQMGTGGCHWRTVESKGWCRE